MANFVGELADRPLRKYRRRLENLVINQVTLAPNPALTRT